MAALRVPIWIFFVLLALVVICLLALLVCFRDSHALIFALLVIAGVWGLAYRVKRACRPISISTTIDVPPSRIWMIVGVLVIALLAAALSLWLRLTVRGTRACRGMR